MNPIDIVIATIIVSYLGACAWITWGVWRPTK